MNHRRKVWFVLLVLAVTLCQVFSAILIGNARILGRAAVMAKGDAETALALSIVGLLGALGALVMALTARGERA